MIIDNQKTPSRFASFGNRHLEIRMHFLTPSSLSLSPLTVAVKSPTMVRLLPPFIGLTALFPGKRLPTCMQWQQTKLIETGDYAGC